MNYRSFFILVLTAFFSVCVLFAQEQTVKFEQKKVFLAYEKTNFKKSLVDEIKKILEEKSITVTILEHSKKNLSKVNPDSYDAVFITNSGVNSKVRPWVLEWLNNNLKSAAKIILHTTQTRNWKVDAPVDAVTSASLAADVKQLAVQYAELIFKRIQQPQLLEADSSINDIQ